MNKKNKISAVLLISFIFFSCGENYTPEQQTYIEDVKQFRIEKDDYMKNNPGSPFNYKSRVDFKPLKYYRPNPDFVFKSKLFEYDKKDTVIILGTKGEEREIIKFGFVKFVYEKKEFNVNVYQGETRNGEIYYSIWFTDRTTGEETYGVGRYLDFEKHPDEDFIYEIDFNLAYNPYCAYSPEYSCAIPTKEDHIDLAITAGEKNFH